VLIKRLLTVILFMQMSFAYANESLTGTWRNDAGSEMELVEDLNGNLSGVYRTALGCEQGVAKPLVGWRNKNAVSFSVNFQDCGSLTAWSGHISNGKISTLWQLAKADAGWNQILAGSATFRRVID